MRRAFGEDQVFQVASILAAISVPMLTAIASIQAFAGNLLPIRLVAITGCLFLFAALWAFAELVEIRKLPLVSSRTVLFVGLICLLAFQIFQTFVIF